MFSSARISWSGFSTSTAPENKLEYTTPRRNCIANNSTSQNLYYLSHMAQTAVHLGKKCKLCRSKSQNSSVLMLYYDPEWI